jgi:RND family efflux transporter MFP subunit
MAAALLGMAAVAGWLFLKARHAKDVSDPERARGLGRPIPVRTELVREERATQVIGATGVTEPSLTATVRIGPSRALKLTDPVSEIVVKVVHVQEGDRVKPGQLLFELEDTVLQDVLRHRELRYATARQKLKRVQEQVSHNRKLRELDLASRKAERLFRIEDLGVRKRLLDALKSLFPKAVKNAEFYDALSKYAEAQFLRTDSDRHVERAEVAVKVGKLGDEEELDKAQADLEAAALDLKLARHDVERGKIRSPLAGFIRRVDIAPGTVVGAADPLTQVLKLDPIRVRVDLPQERLTAVAVGQQAEVVLDSFANETFRGTVIAVSPQVNPQLRVCSVLVELPNPDNRIKAGISGFVRLGVSKTVRTVPATALLDQGGKTVAFRVEGDRVRVREVAAGPLLKTGVREVRAGLTAGDEVVIFHNLYRHANRLASGQGYLQDNDPVDTAWRKWARRE